MPANNSKGIVHYWAGKYPGKIGWLVSPFSWKTPPSYMPYAIDNGAFTRWEPEQFLKILRLSTRSHRPLWIIVPDVVGDAEATLKKWHFWNRRVAPFGPLAFAVQDGMEPSDVPQEAYCTFIGGTTKFKGQAERFKGTSKWLHVGRVNGAGRLRWAQMIGADSVDGTGFFRGDTAINAKAEMIEMIEGQKQYKIFDY